MPCRRDDLSSRVDHALLRCGSDDGSGDRSERIRTYNFPQNRLTDHRIGLTLYKLDQIVEGDIDQVVEPVRAYFQAEALKAQED